MAIVTTDNQHYIDIAAALRTKTGTISTYLPSEMADAINGIIGVEEIATAEEMNSLLVAGNVGKYYKYIGITDDVYTNGNLYLVDAS